jgi:hypothetical protein
MGNPKAEGSNPAPCNKRERYLQKVLHFQLCFVKMKELNFVSNFRQRKSFKCLESSANIDRDLSISTYRPTTNVGRVSVNVLWQPMSAEPDKKKP